MTRLGIRHAPDHAWYIHLDSPFDRIYADSLDGEPPPRYRGAMGQVRFVFEPVDRNPGDVGDPREHYDRYHELMEITRHAGGYVLHSTPRNRYRYVPQTPDGARSLLVGLEPAYDTPATDGVWALVDGYRDETARAEDVIFVTLEVTIIATFDDYGSRAEAQQELRS